MLAQMNADVEQLMRDTHVTGLTPDEITRITERYGFRNFPGSDFFKGDEAGQRGEPLPIGASKAFHLGHMVGSGYRTGLRGEPLPTNCHELHAYGHHFGTQEREQRAALANMTLILLAKYSSKGVASDRERSYKELHEAPAPRTRQDFFSRLARAFFVKNPVDLIALAEGDAAAFEKRLKRASQKTGVHLPPDITPADIAAALLASVRECIAAL